MDEKICKGLTVEIDFADFPVSMVGTILHVDSQALVVSLRPDQGQDGPMAPVSLSGGVRVLATAADALFGFTSKLLRSSGLLLYLSPPTDVQRIQRRADVRERCLLDVEFVAPTDHAGPAKPERGTLVDISCGGLLLIYEGDMEVGDTVEVSVKFPRGDPPLQVAGTVVRTEQLSSSRRDLSRVAVHLAGLTMSDRKRVFQFIMGLQVRAATGTVRGGR
jgi:c-di-GMP-binding flagellar brake protein YcgR